jgi:multiple antibiotic resistance protein
MLPQILSYALGTFLALFPIANPMGAVPIFYALTANSTPTSRREQARWTAINVTWVLALFLLAGHFILLFFGLTLGVLRIAGGLIVGHTGWEMVTVHERLTSPETAEATSKEDITFTPLAVPLISGPGAIGGVIAAAEKATTFGNYLGCLLGIAVLGGLTYLCLVLGEPFIKVLGKTGVGALNRVLGFLILAIAVQLVTEGSFAVLQERMPGLLK